MIESKLRISFPKLNISNYFVSQVLSYLFYYKTYWRWSIYLQQIIWLQNKTISCKFNLLLSFMTEKKTVIIPNNTFRVPRYDIAGYDVVSLGQFLITILLHSLMFRNKTFYITFVFFFLFCF